MTDKPPGMPQANLLSQRYGAMSWKEQVKNVDAGIAQMLFYCESNQDWLKAIEANELLQSKLSSFASLLGKFATGSIDSPNEKTTGPMFGVAKKQPNPFSMDIGAPSNVPPSSRMPPGSGLIHMDPYVGGSSPSAMVSEESLFPPQQVYTLPPPPLIASTNQVTGTRDRPISLEIPESLVKSGPSFCITNNPAFSGRVGATATNRQSAIRLRPDAPALLPKKEESDFMRATEASMAKVRRVASTNNVTSKEITGRSSVANVNSSSEVRNSNEYRHSIGIYNNSTTSNCGFQIDKPAATIGSSHIIISSNSIVSNNVNKNRRESAGPGVPFVVPPPATAFRDGKDDWEEKVKAEMQAATEQVWQAAEAWVDAEAEVEELEWRILEMGIGRYVGLIDAPIDVDETDGGKIEVKSAKKEKLVLDTAFHNVENSSYWAVRHLSTENKSPEKRSAKCNTPQQSDEYSSPQQVGSGGSSTNNSGIKLHSKLSSPDRKRSLTPTEALRKIEARLSAAEVNRDRSVHEKVQKAQMVSNRVKMRNEKEAERLLNAGAALHTKLRSALQRHSDYIAVIKGRAGSENARVSEVVTANALNSEMVSQQLQQKLEEVEAKILAANLRREQRLAGISGSQKKKNSKKSLQMSEYRLQIEKVKMDRWEKLQRRIDSVQERRRVRIAEMKRRAEDEAQKKEEEMTFYALSDSLDPIAEDVAYTRVHPGVLLRLSDNSATTADAVTTNSQHYHNNHRVTGTSSCLHNSPARKKHQEQQQHPDDDSEMISLVAENEGLFLSPEWMEISLEMYSDFKTTSSLAHKLLTETLMKAKIRQWRKDAYVKALSCLWTATGPYHHYYTADLVGTNEPLKAVMEHLIARRKSLGEGEEREVSSFNMYSGLICEIGTDGLFQHPEAIEKINFVLASIVDQLPLSMVTNDPINNSSSNANVNIEGASASKEEVAKNASSIAVLVDITDISAPILEPAPSNAGGGGTADTASPVVVPSIFQPVDDFVSSGGLLLLTAFFSHEFGLLSEGGMESAWLIDSKWFDVESKVLLGKATSVDLQAILRLVRIAVERIDNNILLACCALHLVLGEIALYLSLIIYRGRCENITFSSSENASTQKLQEILGEVFTLWALLIEKLILMTQQSEVIQTVQLFSLTVPGRVGISIAQTSQTSTSPLSAFSTSVLVKNNAFSLPRSASSSLSEESLALNRQLDEILFSYFQYTLLCQDMSNFFTSMHVAVLSVQLSIEEAYSAWKKDVSSSGSTTVASTIALSKACNAAFLRMITGAAEYATSLTVFIRWAKSHHNSAYNALAKHWWSLMRKENVMQFLYGSLVLTTKPLFLSLYCHSGALTVTDIDVMLQSNLALMKAIFAMLMVDAEIFKQLSMSQKSSFMFHCHVLLLLLTKLIDYGKEGVTDKALHPTLGELNEEILHYSKQWAESSLQQLLFLLTLITQRDINARRVFGDKHHLEDISKLESFMRQTMLCTNSDVADLRQSLFHELVSLPTRYFKASRFKHTVCTCIISACMEMEQYVLMVRQAGRERYIQKFVEYMLREFETEAAEHSNSTRTNYNNTNTIPLPSQEIGVVNREDGDEDHRTQRRGRIQRCLTLIPEEYWKTVIHLVWSKDN